MPIKTEAIKKTKDFIDKQGGGSLKIHKNSDSFQEDMTYSRSKDLKQSRG